MQPYAVTVDELAEAVADLSRHVAIWRFLIDPENHKRFQREFREHHDFFEATCEAHFQAIIVNTYQLMDSRKDVVSLRAFLNRIRSSQTSLVAHVEALIQGHQEIFDRLAVIRHKVFAHRDAQASPGLVLATSIVTPNSIDACIDTLCAAVNDLYNAFSHGESPFECYDEADNRARFAVSDLERVLEALWTAPRVSTIAAFDSRDAADRRAPGSDPGPVLSATAPQRSEYPIVARQEPFDR